MHILAILCLVGAALAQHHQAFNRDPQTAAILSEQRYLSGDGTFGSAYKQEDGVEFKEESDIDGTRHGSYSYVDPTGARRTVTYTAGKNGFVASGDHIPQAPAAAAPVAPQPLYTPQPQYQAPEYDDGQYRQSGYQAQPQYNSAPAYQPPQQQYQPQPQQYQAQQQYQPPQQQYQPQQQQYQPQPQQYQAQPQYQPTTPAPHRFFPPGKLNLQRSPDGFQYSFNKA